MPRVSYGPKVKARSQHLLAALLTYANGDFEAAQSDLTFTWLDRERSRPRLRVETKLRILQALTKDASFPEGLTRHQLREAIERLQDYLDILEDNRVQTQGKENWRFTLTLWSTDPDTNLQQFDREWERRRPAQSLRVLGEEPNTAPVVEPEEDAIDSNNNGVSRYEEDCMDAALSEFKKALQRDPKLAGIHYNRGSIYEQVLDLDRARREYQKAMIGGFAAAYSNMARLCILEGNYGSAGELLKRGLRQVEKDVNLARTDQTKVRYALLKNLGWLRLVQERYTEAEESLRAAIALDDSRAAAHCLLAQMLEAMDSPTDARSEWRLCHKYACSDHPDEDIWTGMAQHRLANQDRQ